MFEICLDNWVNFAALLGFAAMAGYFHGNQEDRRYLIYLCTTRQAIRRCPVVRDRFGYPTATKGLRSIENDPCSSVSAARISCPDCRYDAALSEFIGTPAQLFTFFMDATDLTVLI